VLGPKEEKFGEGDRISLGVVNGDWSRHITVPMGGKLNVGVVLDIVWCNVEAQKQQHQLRVVPIYTVTKRESSKQRRVDVYSDQQETRRISWLKYKYCQFVDIC
jgi:hypothetical protein